MKGSNSIWILFICIYLWSEVSDRVECINDQKCNFNRFQSGCLDKTGSQCDQKSQKCVCKPDYTIELQHHCLKLRYMGEKCFTTSQCNHIPNAGCYNYREEFKENPSTFFGLMQSNWPSGMCRCKMGHKFESDSNSCVKRIIGSWCSNLWDCRHEDKRLVNAVCENNECKCSPNHDYNQTTHDCHYRETYGNACSTKEECIHPVLCINNTCDCPHNYHLDNEKAPKCQPNNNLNDIKSDPSLDVPKDDKTFEIFILTVIPIVIIFLTLKPCLKKFGKCKPQTDEVICGHKEISIKCSDMPTNPHKFCEKLQTIEEVVEEIKAKDEDIASQVDDKGDDDRSHRSCDSCEQRSEKSIDIQLPKDNKVDETTISMECSASACANSANS